jgi:hypothetical protein
VSSSVWALVGENQVLGLCQLDSWAQSLHQLAEVLRVVVVLRVVEERAVFVVEVFFMLVIYEWGMSKLRLVDTTPSAKTS